MIEDLEEILLNLLRHGLVLVKVQNQAYNVHGLGKVEGTEALGAGIRLATGRHREQVQLVQAWRQRGTGVNHRAVDDAKQHLCGGGRIDGRRILPHLASRPQQQKLVGRGSDVDRVRAVGRQSAAVFNAQQEIGDAADGQVQGMRERGKRQTRGLLRRHRPVCQVVRVARQRDAVQSHGGHSHIVGGVVQARDGQ